MLGRAPLGRGSHLRASYAHSPCEPLQQWVCGCGWVKNRKLYVFFEVLGLTLQAGGRTIMGSVQIRRWAEQGRANRPLPTSMVFGRVHRFGCSLRIQAALACRHAHPDGGCRWHTGRPPHSILFRHGAVSRADEAAVNEGERSPAAPERLSVLARSHPLRFLSGAFSTPTLNMQFSEKGRTYQDPQPLFFPKNGLRACTDLFGYYVSSLGRQAWRGTKTQKPHSGELRSAVYCNFIP